MSSGATYQWTGDGSLTDANTPVPTASPTQTTTYSVTVTGPNGCTSEDQVTVFVHTNTSANAGDDVTECGGIGSQLHATGGMSYEWSPVEGLDNPLSARPFANPTTTTTYTESVMDFNGCIATDQMTYTVTATQECAPPVNCNQDVLDITEACIDSEDMVRICLPYTLANLTANYTISTSTGNVVPNHGCDFIPVYSYPLSLIHI